MEETIKKAVLALAETHPELAVDLAKESTASHVVASLDRHWRNLNETWKKKDDHSAAYLLMDMLKALASYVDDVPRSARDVHRGLDRSDYLDWGVSYQKSSLVGLQGALTKLKKASSVVEERVAAFRAYGEIGSLVDLMGIPQGGDLADQAEVLERYYKDRL